MRHLTALENKGKEKHQIKTWRVKSQVKKVEGKSLIHSTAAGTNTKFTIYFHNINILGDTNVDNICYKYIVKTSKV